MEARLAEHSAGAWDGRVEDSPLIQGRGRFADDVRLPGQVHGVFVRSTHAHARIRGIATGAALASPGVVAVLTEADVADLASATGSAPLPGGHSPQPLAVPFRPTLAGERVMHVGDPIALVIAESVDAATDAAELVEVDYDPLPAVVDARAALEAGAPLLWPDIAGNLAVDWAAADNLAAVDAAIAAAPRVVRARIVNQRIAGVPLEPRCVTAEFDAAGGRYTFHGGSQSAGALAHFLAGVLRVGAGGVRVLSGDVGGAFGLKTPPYPEYAALLVAAKKVGRPVHWVSTRSEAFLSDHHGRDNSADVVLALDEEGRFLALKAEAVTNLGAYSSSAGSTIATMGFANCMPGMYDIPAVHVGVRLVYTNTVPTGPYRGAGRPEANYAMERIIDMAARETGIDPVELRRRNLIDKDAMPYRTALGKSYDSGDFPGILHDAVAAADLAGFQDRRRASASRGRLRGLGVSCFLEQTGALAESAIFRFGEGRLEVLLGMQASGQGHLTVFRDLVADRLGIPRDRVVIREGDSDFGIKGGPAVGSRSMLAAGPAACAAADSVVDKGRVIAAGMLEAAEADIRYAAGAFSVVGTDRRVDLFEVAARAARLAEAGDIAESLDSVGEVVAVPTFPNGCHVAEVEIDPDTGAVDVVAYSAVDDCGTVLNPTMAEGQVIGGIIQGVGQGLVEAVRYDADGQMLSGTFMDYGMPRAADMPSIYSAFHPAPAMTNPLGVKGVGEAGSTAAIGAVMNAIADAIPGGKGADLTMPATPDKVWAACRA